MGGVHDVMGGVHVISESLNVAKIVEMRKKWLKKILKIEFFPI